MSDYFSFTACTKYSSLYNKNLNEDEFIEYFTDVYDGRKIIEYRMNYKLHHRKKAADVIYHAYSNKISHIHFYINGKHWNGLSYLVYNTDGFVNKKAYYYNTIMYRCTYYVKGKIERDELYNMNGISGLRVYNNDGELVFDDWSKSEIMCNNHEYYKNVRLSIFPELS